MSLWKVSFGVTSCDITISSPIVRRKKTLAESEIFGLVLEIGCSIPLSSNKMESSMFLRQHSSFLVQSAAPPSFCRKTMSRRTDTRSSVISWKSLVALAAPKHLRDRGKVKKPIMARHPKSTTLPRHTLKKHYSLVPTRYLNNDFLGPWGNMILQGAMQTYRIIVLPSLADVDLSFWR